MANNKKPFNRKLLLLLFLNFTVFFIIYQVFVYFELIIGMWLFLIAGCAIFVAYFFTCRGFSPRITPSEELPDDWSAIQKCEYRKSEEKRIAIAKKLLLFLIPIILVFLVDLTMLYFPDIIKMITPKKI